MHVKSVRLILRQFLPRDSDIVSDEHCEARNLAGQRADSIHVPPTDSQICRTSRVADRRVNKRCYDTIRRACRNESWDALGTSYGKPR